MRNYRRRAVITGLGVVAPNGVGKQAFWEALVAGESAVDVVSAFDPSPYECKVAAEVRRFRPEDFMHVRRTRHRGRFSQFAVAAAKLAVTDANLTLPGKSPDRVLACIGTSANGISDIYETARTGLYRSGVAGVPPMSGIEYAAHAPVSHVSAELGVRGQAITLASACATGLDVVEWSFSKVRDGTADVVLCGCTDAPISEVPFAAFCALKVLSTFTGPPSAACRPYDYHRSGFVMGEGAAVLIVEELEHALRRRATIYAEILGFGSGNEGGYPARTDSARLALADAIQTALLRAQLRVTDIDHINAHGNALPDYDLTETHAFKCVLGGHAYNVPVTSIKSMIGHAMGAAAGLQVVAACLTIKHGIIPPTINLNTPDPECDLDYVPNTARVSRVRRALVNAHALGGTHSALVLGAYYSG